MKLFDTHCHINDEQFSDDFDAVIQNMLAAGVERAVVVGDASQNPIDVFDIAEQYDFLFAASGVHPHNADKWSSETEKIVTELMARKKAVALGEIGLDYHYDLSPRDIQKKAFQEQLDLAFRLGKPAVLHIREAHGDAYEILTAARNAGRLPKCIMHCYTGSWESAKTYLSMGMYISFSGAVTFKNAPKLWETAENMPLDRLLIETDCPYMAPVPMRGKRNEPAYVAYVLKRIAEIRGIDEEYAADATYKNALDAFGLE